MTPDPTTHFDDQIRQRLTELPPATAPATGWDRLSAELSAGAADQVAADDQLRDKLSDPQGLGLQPAGWSALASRLDLDPAAAPSDHFVAEQLNGLDAATAPTAGWERLERSLDRLADAPLARQLASMEPATASGWAGLAARLELIGQRRELVAALKVTELCLVLSFLLLLFHPNGMADYLLPAPGALDDFPVAVSDTPVAAAMSGEGASVTFSEVVGGLRTTETRADQLAESTVAIPATLPVAGLTSGPASIYRSGAATVAPSLTTDETVSAPVQTSSGLPTQSANDGVGREEIPYSASADEAPPASVYALPELAQLSYAVGVRSITPAPPLKLDPMAQPVETDYYLNLFYSPFDFNEVITRETYYRKTYTIDGERRFTYGASGGALLELVRGNTGVQFGAIYARRSYIPTQLKWFNANEGELGYSLVEPFRGGYSRLIYNSVTLPVHFTQTVFRREKWNVTARFGAALNVIVTSEFFTEDGDELSVQELTANTSPFAPQNQGAGRAKSTEGSVYDLANPEPGYLQGGSLISNSRFEIGGGFRVERLLGDHVSIYVAPSFGRTLYVSPEAGVGPYLDRMHTYNFRFGSRFLLGKK